MAFSKNKRKESRAIFRAFLFLSPSIVGFAAFTLIPIIFSFGMAFTNWDLTLHNSFTEEPLQFIGLDNFARLFNDPYFWQYLGNTFYLMLGIPFGIAGSLAFAVLLNSKLHGPKGKQYKPLVIMAISVATGLLLLVLGMSGGAFATLVVGLIGMMLVGGALGGSTIYRTLFYLPHFTQGVAIFILWKKLYNPQTGPINRMLEPLLDSFSALVLALPETTADNLFAIPLLLVALLLFSWLKGSLKKWTDGELGRSGLMLSALCLSGVSAYLVLGLQLEAWTRNFLLAALALMIALSIVFQCLKRFETTTTFTGTARHLLYSGFIATLVALGLILTAAFTDLPAKASAGILPPNWLTDYAWAKPSLILMGLWASIGGNNMILYLAGLSNISPDYYEAADIDGANQWQKFKYITWPQLAPVTFFIVVMSVIYGLQGGFEMARTMTEGGPAGATTTLSYFIYSEGFETGRLGYASAVAWVLFLMVFALSMLNWKFGNRYVSE